MLVAEDLSPADTAALDVRQTPGHRYPRAVRPPTPPFWRAPVASSRSSPPPKPPELENSANVIVNAAKGEIVVNPSEDEIARRQKPPSPVPPQPRELRGKPGATRTATTFPLLANVGKPPASEALEWRRGVGLFPSWIPVYPGAPSRRPSKEQTKAYAELLNQFPAEGH